MTLNDLSDENVSLSMISKFERGDSDISLSRFIHVLDKLGLSLSEFELLCIKQVPENSLKRISVAFQNNDIFLLKRIEKEENNIFLKTGVLQHQHKSLFCKFLRNRLNSTRNKKEDCNKIWDYLSKIENWNYYELTLFNNMMFIFSKEKIGFLARTALKRALYFKKMSSMHNEFCLVLLNLITFFLENEDLKNAHYFIVQATDILKTTEFIYEKNKLLFLQGIYLIKVGDKKAGIKKSEKAIITMNEFDLATLANQHYLYLEKLKY